MTPEPDDGFAARCVALCPSFVGAPSVRMRARKSQLIAGVVDGLPVVARPNAVWSWYLIPLAAFALIRELRFAHTYGRIDADLRAGFAATAARIL